MGSKGFKLNEAQVRFLKAHFSSTIPPFLLAAVFVLAFKIFLFHRSTREEVVELKGHLANVTRIKGQTDLDHIYEVTLKEYPQTFLTSKMKIADQNLLMGVERPGNEVTFTVEKIAIDNQIPRVQFLSLKSETNIYMRPDKTALIMSADRSVALFMAIASLVAMIFLVRRLKKAYLVDAAKPVVPDAPQIYDPTIVWFVLNPNLVAKIVAIGMFIFLLIFLPSGTFLLSLAMSIVSYFGFKFWYRKYGSALPWVKGALAYYTAQEEKRKANKVATVAPKHVQAVELLLKSGADINVQGGDGQTALHISVQKSSAEAVDLLLRSGAHVNVTDKNGETPLMNAAKVGHVGIAMKLIEKGADVLARSNSGQSALAIAESEKKNKAMVQILQTAVKKAEARIKEEAQKKLEEEKKAAEAAKKASNG